MGKDRKGYSKTDLEATFMRMKEKHMFNCQLVMVEGTAAYPDGEQRTGWLHPDRGGIWLCGLQRL